MPRFGALKTEGGLVKKERDAWWKAAKAVAAASRQSRSNDTCGPIPESNV
jgi:hypothetical protein